MRSFVWIIWIFLLPSSDAQPYITGGKTRHRFAQLNLGFDTKIFPASGSESAFISPNGLDKFKLRDQARMRMIIGGTHFWGHADFYVAIPTVSLRSGEFFTSTETGARYFPWRITHNKIRPYLSIAQLPMVFRQGEGTSMLRFRYPLGVGFVWNHGVHMLEFNAGYIFNNNLDYFISPDMRIRVKTPPVFLSLGYKILLETTAIGERNWINGKTQRYTDTLASKGRLNNFSIAAGPSSSFFLKSSSHNRDALPFLDDHKAVKIFADLGLGYYLHKPDLHFNLAFRMYKSLLSAYGYSQTARRRAITLEAYKFFADYHGFCPFIGTALSYETLSVSDKNPQGIISVSSYEGFKPGITIGWDIRPNRILSWYLRTNIRYFPNMGVKMDDGKTVRFDQLEVNFIQLVIYPGRFGL